MPVFLNLVRPDVDPDAPTEERVDREATLKMRRAMAEAGMGQSSLITSANEAFNIAVPSAQDIRDVERMRSDRQQSGVGICGLCRHFDLEGGQARTADPKYRQALAHTFSSEALAALFGDLRSWGRCRHSDSLTQVKGIGCDNWETAERSFGRMLGGVWKRIRDI